MHNARVAATIVIITPSLPTPRPSKKAQNTSRHIMPKKLLSDYNLVAVMVVLSGSPRWRVMRVISAGQKVRIGIKVAPRPRVV